MTLVAVTSFSYQFVHNIFYTFRCGYLEILAHVDRIKTQLKVPDETDLKGIASGIARLQKFYRLNAGEIADGSFNEVETK